MNNRLFPRMCLVIPLIISFLFMPVNTVNAAGYSSDADFWRWWYIEHQTDAITDGQGASAENIQNTESGQTAGTVIYNQSGVTRGDFIDYVEEQYNQAEGYLQKGVEYYVDAVNHVYDSTVTAGTKAAYGTQKAVREVVDASGKVIVDVSGSDFWHSAYNGLFNGNGYKEIYADVSDGSTNVNVGQYNVNFQYVGIGDYSYYTNSSNYVTPNEEIFASRPPLFSSYVSSNTAPNFPIGKMTIDSNVYYFPIGSQVNIYSDYYGSNTTQANTTTVIVSVKYWNSIALMESTNSQAFIFNDNINSIGSGGTPVLQPSQMGFIIDPSTGDRIPVYTDPSQNPFTINDDGTVDYNGTNYPIYIDPDDLSPDGWLKILEYIDNQDETQNPYNPQGQPWNTQNDGSVLGGFFSNLISDIGNLFSGLVDKLKEIVDKIANFFTNFIDNIVNAIKKFIEIFIGDLDLDAMTDFDITNPFSMVQDCYDLLLELLGVNTT